MDIPVLATLAVFTRVGGTESSLPPGIGKPMHVYSDMLNRTVRVLTEHGYIAHVSHTVVSLMATPAEFNTLFGVTPEWKNGRWVVEGEIQITEFLKPLVAGVFMPEPSILL